MALVRFTKGVLWAHFFKRILSGEALEVFGDGTQQRDFLYIDDLTNGAISALKSEVNGVFNLAQDNQHQSTNSLMKSESPLGLTFPLR